jgi:glycolate oxidase
MDKKIIDEIIRIIGKENALFSEEDRRCYSYDARTDGTIPDLVVFPSSAREVSQILLLANKYLFPVIPRGSGSGLTGGSVPVKGVWCSRLQR